MESNILFGVDITEEISIDPDLSRITQKMVDNEIGRLEVEITNCREATAELNEIMMDTNKTDLDFLVCLSSLVKVVDNKELRFLYHDISLKAYNSKKDNLGEIQEENWEELTNINIDVLDTYLFGEEYKEFAKSFIDQRKIFIKILDHYNLVSLQTAKLYEEVKDTHKKIEKVNKMIDTAENDVTEYQNKVTKIEDKFKKSQIDILSVLSIFTGISFIMFAGTAMTDKASYIAEISNYPINIAMTISLIGFILINSLGVLLSFIKNIHNDNYSIDELYIKKYEGKRSYTGLMKVNIYLLIFAVIILILSIIPEIILIVYS